MKTAVEWFFEQIMYADVDIKVWREIYEQAKEMEKEHIMDARLDGFKISAEGWNGEHPFEGVTDYYIMLDINNDEYYNQTFKSE
jgi:hypothetical protein